MPVFSWKGQKSRSQDIKCDTKLAVCLLISSRSSVGGSSACVRHFATGWMAVCVLGVQWAGQGSHASWRTFSPACRRCWWCRGSRSNSPQGTVMLLIVTDATVTLKLSECSDISLWEMNTYLPILNCLCFSVAAGTCHKILKMHIWFICDTSSFIRDTWHVVTWWYISEYWLIDWMIDISSPCIIADNCCFPLISTGNANLWHSSLSAFRHYCRLQ